MIRIELKRLYQNTLVRWFILVLLVVFGVSVMMNFYGSDNQAYKSEYNQLSSIESIEHAYLENQLEAYEKYTNELQSRIENNETKLTISLFSNDFVRAQIKAENETLKRIQDIEFEMMPGYAATQMLESPIFSILVLVLSAVLVYALFLEDMIRHTMGLFKSTKHSLSRLFLVKGLVFISVMVSFTLICLGITLILIHLDGLDLSAPIQSLMDYRFNLNFMTIFEQLFSRMFTQSIAALFAGFLVVMLVLITGNLSLGYGAVLLLMLAEFFLYSFTSVASSFTLVKYINLYSYLFGALTHLRWVLFANIMLNFKLIACISTALAFIITVMTSVRLYTQMSNGFTIRRSKGYQVKSVSLVLHEFLRTFFFSKAFLLILLVLAYSLNRYMTFNVSKSQGQLAYERIESQYYGPLTQSSFDSINQAIEASKPAYEKMTSGNLSDLSQDEVRALDEKGKHYRDYERVREKMLEKKASGAVYFTDELGYKFIFGEEGKFSLMIHFILIMMALSLYITLNVYNEYQKRLEHLYVSTPKGHLNKQRIDLMLYYALAVFLTIAVYALFILKLQKGYAVYTENQTLVNITQATTSSLTLMSYSVISFGMHLLVYFTIVRVVYVLARQYDIAVMIVLMLVFCLVQVTLFSLIPSLSILHLLSITLINHPLISLVWVLILIGVNVLIKIKALTQFEA